MKTPVSAWLGIFDIIFSLYENDIILFQKTFFQFIDIVRERTDHPDTGDVFDIFFNRGKTHGDIFAPDLFGKTFRRFHTAFDGFDGVLVVFQGIFLIQYTEFRLNLHDRTLVIRHHKIKRFLIFLNKIKKFIRKKTFSYKFISAGFSSEPSLCH